MWQLQDKRNSAERSTHRHVSEGIAFHTLEIIISSLSPQLQHSGFPYTGKYLDTRRKIQVSGIATGIDLAHC